LQKIGYIKYLNSQPLYVGLTLQEQLNNNLQIITGNPRELTQLFDSGELDFGQMSTFSYLQRQKDFDCLDNFCIASRKGGVDSVLLFSRKPIHDLDDESIALTLESLTSAQLLKVLMAEKYKLKPTWINERVDLCSLEKEDFTAVLLIGDQALAAEQQRFNGELKNWFCYDLASLWFEWTGLPFVFAVFVSRKGKKLNPDLMKTLSDNLQKNLKSIDSIIESNASSSYSKELLRKYFGLLDYELDEQKRESIQKFKKLSIVLD
jgi:chorismate dehydratase